MEKKDFRRANVKKNFFIIQALFKKSEEHLRVKNEEKPPAYSLLFYSVLITKKRSISQRRENTSF
ncbi:hypothetical protein CGC50_02035 [Capnocytophaga gingivalis]|uniref:Uncharacterized protein n=1 Tax=Capnocytophaga gingivalis TaxID=1017 RepID=A0A250FPZ6_9FLAO|nr:hypothetical protein CGC50_02035 [Capnocytophaga gingivalis]